MGEVYRATDTRLDRTVAVKVLPQHVAADPELKQRFEREAKTLAALSHPHICPIHDVGSQDGIDFLVMEYLEGETLEQRLKKGALPLDQALQVAIQIADALAVAHRAGIVHRDLKPGNVMLTKSGAKLLDFGLAKTGAPAATGSLSMLPTAPPNLTQQGAILGTFQYMAPEQLEGKDADARTDIFAFGTLLYEMVTGKKAFEGTSQASLIAAILDHNPPAVSSSQPLASPGLDRSVAKCLAKDPEARWQTARDLRSELEWIAEERSQRRPAAARAGGRTISVTLAVGVVLAATVVASLVIWSLAGVTAPAEDRRVRFAIPLATQDQLQGFALSPDGATLVYSMGQGNTRQLYRRTLDQLETTPVRGTEGGRYPFFSPDGAWIGFEADGTLKKLPSTGGLPMTILDRPSGFRATNATWGSDDRILFGVYGEGAALHRTSVAGGIPQDVTRLGPGETQHLWPEILPGGAALLYSLFPSMKIVVQSLETGARRDIAEGAQPRYLPSGHIVFVRGTSLWAVPFDLGHLSVTGPAVPVVDGVSSVSMGTSYNSVFTVARNGTLVYRRGQQRIGQRLVWVTRDGREETASIELGGPLHNPRLSPDGTRLAVVRGDAPESTNEDVWVYDLTTNTERQLTFDPAPDLYPVWTPDGQRIVFTSSRAGGRNLFWRPADGTGRDEQLTTSPNAQSPWTWSRDRMELILVERGPKTDWDIWVLSMTGDRSPHVLIQTPFAETSPAVSPDGRWIAYYSGESGRSEVYVRPFPNVDDGKWRVSRDGGGDPLWGPDGRELFYLSIDGAQLIAVPVITQPTFSAGAPKILFERQYIRQSGVLSYDVAPDGRRFLMIEDTGRENETSVQPELIVVLNWLDELKRLVPTK
jgi:Tol biopolymer transport system component